MFGKNTSNFHCLGWGELPYPHCQLVLEWASLDCHCKRAPHSLFGGGCCWISSAKMEGNSTYILYSERMFHRQIASLHEEVVSGYFPLLPFPPPPLSQIGVVIFFLGCIYVCGEEARFSYKAEVACWSRLLFALLLSFLVPADDSNCAPPPTR